MEAEELISLIKAGIPDSEVYAKGDSSHFEVTVISPAFADKSMVQEQQMVYATINEHITGGAVHAINIKAYTPEEWKVASKLQVS